MLLQKHLVFTQLRKPHGICMGVKVRTFCDKEIEGALMQRELPSEILAEAEVSDATQEGYFT